MTGKTYAASYEERTQTRQYVPEGSLRGAGWLRNRAAVEEAARRGTTAEAMCVMCDCTTMQLTVDLPDGIRGIIPREEAAWSPGGETKDIAIITRVGKPVQFKITDLYENERGELTAMLSRRAAQRECCERYISALTPGDKSPRESRTLNRSARSAISAAGLCPCSPWTASPFPGFPILPTDSVPASRLWPSSAVSTGKTGGCI